MLVFLQCCSTLAKRAWVSWFAKGFIWFGPKEVKPCRASQRFGSPYVQTDPMQLRRCSDLTVHCDIKKDFLGPSIPCFSCSLSSQEMGHCSHSRSAPSLNLCHTLAFYFFKYKSSLQHTPAVLRSIQPLPQTGVRITDDLLVVTRLGQTTCTLWPFSQMSWELMLVLLPAPIKTNYRCLK